MDREQSALPWDEFPAPPPLHGTPRVWRHTVYLGAYALVDTYESLHRVFADDEDANDERPGGTSACAGSSPRWMSSRVVAATPREELQPVVTVPPKAQRDIAQTYRVSATWIPPRASVQTLADRIATFGTHPEAGRAGRVGERATSRASALRRPDVHVVQRHRLQRHHGERRPSRSVRRLRSDSRADRGQPLGRRASHDPRHPPATESDRKAQARNRIPRRPRRCGVRHHRDLTVPGGGRPARGARRR